MRDTHRVLRHVRIDGALRKPGDLIDASDLRTVDALVSQRYLRPLALDEAPTRGRTATPDPKIAQDRAAEKAAGRKGGPADDVAPDSPVGDTGNKSKGELAAEQLGGKKLRGKLPDDFPGRAALEAAGLTTYATVRKRLETLEEIEGVGSATAGKIRTEFEGSETPDDDESTDDAGSTEQPGPSTVPKASNA